MKFSRTRDWLRLVRPPNLPTVPGDAAAGFFLAGGAAGDGGWGRLAAACGSVVCLYAAGLIWNDVADRGHDGKTHPGRPLPSGRVSPGRAAWGGGILAAAGLATAAAGGWSMPASAAAVLALVLLYDFAAKRCAVGGPVTMGLCRGGSVVLGASAAGLAWTWSWSWLAAAATAAYFAAVTAIARGETRVTSPPKWTCLLPPAVAALPTAVCMGGAIAGGASAWSAVLAIAALAWVGRHAWALRRAAGYDEIGPRVGGLIRTWILMQAAMCAFGGGVEASLILIVLLPVSAVLARWFYAS